MQLYFTHWRARLPTGRRLAELLRPPSLHRWFGGQQTPDPRICRRSQMNLNSAVTTDQFDHGFHGSPRIQKQFREKIRIKSSHLRGEGPRLGLCLVIRVHLSGHSLGDGRSEESVVSTAFSRITRQQPVQCCLPFWRARLPAGRPPDACTELKGRNPVFRLRQGYDGQAGRGGAMRAE